ncbi:MAG: Mitochondrial small ribosomal subunit Rsm22 [Methanocella sp. PtaU1.Bin125]|nr:MAG: Mitochondrial small ribosomal subunit Rsm22 [Methanocella sp. PtaU1.Bin125]
MSNREIVSALKYVSRFRKSFMLSELRQYIKEEKSTAGIYQAVQPLFDGLGLRAVPEGGDYRIEQLPPAGKLTLSEKEIEQQDAFFSAPRVPRKLERLIEKYVDKKTAKSWDDPAVLDKIRKAIVSQKAQYWKAGQARKIDYRSGYSVLGYLAYQFPVYFAQFEHILYDMAREGLLKDRMKVLDAGTGPGVVPLAIIDFYRRLENHEVEVYAIEKYEENLEAYTALVPEFASAGGNVKIAKPFRADLAEKPKIPGGLDMIVFSNVLNEIAMGLDEKADMVMRYVESMAQDGSLVIIEPADKDNSMEMRRLAAALMDRGLGVYSPCSFIWCARCRPESCWSFEEKEDVAPTGLMKKVAETEEPFRYMNTDIKYSYAILRKDDLTREKYRVPPKAKFARLSKLKLHTGKRINVVASKMSGDLGSKKEHVFKICDGTTGQQVYAIIPDYNIVPGNEALAKAKYGAVLEFHNVIVRYNKEHDSYNLMVGKSTEIVPAA